MESPERRVSKEPARTSRDLAWVSVATGSWSRIFRSTPRTYGVCGRHLCLWLSRAPIRLSSGIAVGKNARGIVFFSQRTQRQRRAHSFRVSELVQAFLPVRDLQSVTLETFQRRMLSRTAISIPSSCVLGYELVGVCSNHSCCGMMNDEQTTSATDNYR